MGCSTLHTCGALTAAVLLSACGEVVSSEPAPPTGGGSCATAFGNVETLAYAGEEGASGLVTDDTHVYWTSLGTVRRVAKSGGDVENIRVGSEARNVVLTQDHVLWSEVDDEGGSRIVRLAKGGSGEPETLVSKIPVAVGAMAVLDSDIYWVDHVDDPDPSAGSPVEVHRAANGQSVTVGGVEGGGFTRELYADATGLYFTNGYDADPAGFYRLDWLTLDGTAQPSLAQSRRLVDAALVEGHAFFTESVEAFELDVFVVGISLPAGPRSVLRDPALDPNPGYVGSIAADSRRVFWAYDSGDITARCVNVGGSLGAATLLDNDEGNVGSMMSDGDTLYFTLMRDATDTRIESVALQPLPQ